MSRSKGASPVAFTFLEKSVDFNGTSYKFKELSVGENDFCADAARDPEGKIDGRKMMRLMIVKSAIEPKITLEEVADMPNRMYLRLCEIVNDLNSPEDEGDTPNS